MQDLENIIHYFGLDHLEVYGTFKDETLFDKLDFDNSNYSELDEYKITKNEVNKYKYKIIFTKWEYSLFSYYKWIPKGEKQPIATKDYIVVYSTAFKLLECEEVLWFLQWYLDLKHCRRFDICIDLRIDIDELLVGYFEDYKTWRDYRKWSKTETRYFGEMKGRLNKRQLIRVYNKNLDIVQKKKIALYQDYLIEDHITRVELEIRPELARRVSYVDVFKDPLLLWILKNYLHKYTKIFDSIEWDKISLYQAPEIKLDPEEYQGIYYKNQRRGVFLGHAKAIYNVWFCPVRVLIAEWYIHDKTKIILGEENIDNIHQKEKKVIFQAKENKYVRNNIDWILNNLYKYGKV